MMGMSNKNKKRRVRWAKEGYGTDPLCYLCQSASATTDDHVPPRGLFAATHGVDAYRLPACSPCNGLLVEDEEYLRNVLANSGTNREANSALQAMLRSQAGGSRLYPFDSRARFYRNATVQDIFSPAGVWRGRAPMFEVSMERVRPVVEKIVRGLHYHSHKTSLPPDTQLDVIPFFPPHTAPMTEWLGTMVGLTIAAKGTLSDVLTFGAWPVEDHPNSSMWALIFYRTTGFVVFVADPKIRASEAQYMNDLIVKPPDAPSP